jgi:S1-C subfamily serine protease
VPGDLLDLALLGLTAAFAVAGYRQGFIVGALSFAGFLGGAAIGAVFSPQIAQSLVSSPSQQALVAIVCVFFIAMLGQLLASLGGAALKSRVTWRSATLLDAAGGAAVSGVSALLIAWFIGSALVNAPFPAMASQVSRSLVLRGVDKIMPPTVTTMFSDFRSLLASGPYVQVFGRIGAEGALTVGRPDPAVLRAPALAADDNSIVKILGTAPTCDDRLEGTGFVISPRHVLTNAHVVAGVTRVSQMVLAPGQGALGARVVLFDPRDDVAVLDVPRLTARPLHFAGLATLGADAIVAGYPRDGPFRATPAKIGTETSATAPDIYQSATVTRHIYPIRALVQPGNSGGPLLAPRGAVYGVVFAAAVGVPDVGYALTAREVLPDARAGMARTAAVSSQPWHCD